MEEIVNYANNYIDIAKKVFDKEIAALLLVRDTLSEGFVMILHEILVCRGKVILTGVGKSGHIGSKIAATFASLGTPSFFLHPVEAVHGDLGMVEPSDIVILLSYSGESEEVIRLLPVLKQIGCKTIAVSGNEGSMLVSNADLCYILPAFDEACYMKAPTSSTTAMLVLGDALAVSAAEIRDYDVEDFKLRHPYGSLGKSLTLKTFDIMRKGAENAVVNNNDSLKSVIAEFIGKGLGIVNVLNDDGLLVGVVDACNLQKSLELGTDIYKLPLEHLLNRNPFTIQENEMAVTALLFMKLHNIECVTVVSEDGKVTGTIQRKDILRAGIF